MDRNLQIKTIVIVFAFNDSGNFEEKMSRCILKFKIRNIFKQISLTLKKKRCLKIEDKSAKKRVKTFD